MLLSDVDFEDLVETETNESILSRWEKHRPGVFLHSVIFDLASQFIRRAANYIYVLSIEGKLNGDKLQRALQNDCIEKDITYEAVGIRITWELCPTFMKASTNNTPPEGLGERDEMVSELATFLKTHIVRPSAHRN